MIFSGTSARLWFKRKADGRHCDHQRGRSRRMKTANYPALPWPWVGLLLCCALLGQEYVRQAAGPEAPLTVYNIAIIAVGVTSLALLVLPPRRLAYMLGFAVCAGLMAYALYLQYGVGLEPCPLCIFQRICVIGMGVVFLIAAFHNPGRAGATGYALLQLIIGGAGAGFAARQVRLQALTHEQVSAVWLVC